MTRLLPLLVAFALVSATTLTAAATPRQRTRLEYVVTETHPFTGGIVVMKRYDNKEEAGRVYRLLSLTHWVKWRFVGINEPLRYQRFKSSIEAQRFINSDGPSKSGKLGFAILTNETGVVAGRVTLTTERVPVPGGGGGGGGGTNPGEVIDAIDRIIGIIGR
jgi:hypothetical protein